MFGVEAAARAGYVAKGAIYALIGVLAVQAALGTGGEASGTREAIRTFASVPFGRVVLVLLVVGLTGYVLWRFVQGLFAPVDGSGDRDQGWARLDLRAFYLASAMLHGLLALYAVQLLLGGPRASFRRKRSPEASMKKRRKSMIAPPAAAARAPLVSDSVIVISRR